MDWFHHAIGTSNLDIRPWQECIRAFLIFLFGLVIIRLFGRRAFGRQNALDIVLAIIIGSNLSRALTANAPFLPTIAATASLAFIYWILDHLAARWYPFAYLVKGQPVPLMRDGRLDHETMKRVAVTIDDINEAARTSGKHGLKDLQQAVLERSGKIATVSKG